jgi:transcription-repair coupling factor (superfamily II helicase)
MPALAGLLPLLTELPELKRVLDFAALQEGSDGTLRRAALWVREAAKPAVLAALQYGVQRVFIVVVRDLARARVLSEDLREWSSDAERVLLFPELDAIPYERLPVSAGLAAARMAVLGRLLAERTRPARPAEPGLIVVTTPRGMLHLLPDPQEIAERCIALRPGQQLSMERVLAQLAASGYESVPLVELPGTVSHRGGILDVWPPGEELPVRVEFFGDEIDSVRYFDPETQRSQARCDRLILTPASEVPVWHAATAAEALERLDLSRLRADQRDAWRRHIELLRQGVPFDEASFYMAYFGAHSTLLDYAPQAMLVLEQPERLGQALDELERQAAEMRAKALRGREIPEDFQLGQRPFSDFWRLVAERDVLSLEFGEPATQPAGDASSQRFTLQSFEMAHTYGGQLKHAVEDIQRWRSEQQRVVVVSRQAQRLSELLADEGILVAITERLDRVPLPGSLTLLQGHLAEGWRNPALGLAVIGDAELFGWARPQHAPRRRRVPKPSLFVSDLTPGDYVVHIEHGVARFQGIVRMAGPQGEREYLVLQYAGDDRLYVPTDQLDRVERYIGVGDHTPTLNKLGTSDWARAKQRVRESVQDVARQLLEIYAAREIAQGHAFSPDGPWQRELEAAFPYEETPDQLQAIQDVKADMEKPKPMDRLVCGDVGYGKTEVAVRAAFKAVMDGKQVAVLVPTTVLAQQHFNTFSERMAGFPVTVEMLSRFRTPAEQRKVLAGLRDGTVDIVIGTHRLLQDDVKFKDLGLVVIDEEQRFGVIHKEKLKQLRKEVDVLTLTATPIPRTLHMSLAGVRDMSVIQTPPEDRVPVRTYVTGYNDEIVREAILRELDRGGQVFYVHNRVQTIHQAAQKVAKLVPEARIAVAHGQMDEEKLEQVMVDFSQGKYDVLVCSTIIENGLDLPNVNTIIVTEAWRLGLAQLYQLRGRVGRGVNQGYAYFLYDKDHVLTEQAEKRLRTIFENTELGAGFKIAMKDLEIRGAGNLLGPEQHGFMNAVGFDLYCRLLAQAVEEQRARLAQGASRDEAAAAGAAQALSLPQTAVDLPLDALIPESYIPDLTTKMNFYQRMAAVTTRQQIDELEHELRDRFGPLPPQVKNLLFILRVKVAATDAGVQSISGKVEGYALRKVVELELKLWPGVMADRVAAFRAFGQNVRIQPGVVRLRSKLDGDAWRTELLHLLGLLQKVEATATAPAKAGV